MCYYFDLTFLKIAIRTIYVMKQISCDFMCQVEKNIRDSHVKMNIVLFFACWNCSSRQERYRSLLEVNKAHLWLVKPELRDLKHDKEPQLESFILFNLKTLVVR